MDFSNVLKSEIFDITDRQFEGYALEAFQFQSKYNLVYLKYLEILKIEPSSITKLETIPFLPIEFFKNFQIIKENAKPELVFESSGTTGQNRSKHFVADRFFYQQICESIYSQFFGKLSNTAFIALLPSYAERNGSSLIYMVQHFINSSAFPNLGFFLHNYEDMLKQLKICKEKGVKTMLIGVSFALLDLAEKSNIDLSGITIIETGGMKGRRKEMVREELHQVLIESFSVNEIASEYGMTELLSQAYAIKKGEFESPNWMKVLIRNPDDPFDKTILTNKRGGINIIDLANIDSCCFIETKDLGELLPNGKFKILGRFDNSEIRGCNLLVS